MKECIKRKRKLKLSAKNNQSKTLSKFHGGTITYDSVTKIHLFIYKLLKISKLPKNTSFPIAVGSKKVKNYAFTKNKFYKKLQALYESHK